MTEIEKWMEGKTPEIAGLAALVAFAPTVSDALIEMRSQDFSMTPQPHLRQWLPLYRQHRKIILHLQTYLFNETVFPALLPSAFDEKVVPDADILKLVSQGFNKPETLFFFKVWGPCWLLYKASPRGGPGCSDSLAA